MNSQQFSITVWFGISQVWLSVVCSFRQGWEKRLIYSSSWAVLIKLVNDTLQLHLLVHLWNLLKFHWLVLARSIERIAKTWINWVILRRSRFTQICEKRILERLELTVSCSVALEIVGDWNRIVSEKAIDIRLEWRCAFSTLLTVFHSCTHVSFILRSLNFWFIQKIWMLNLVNFDFKTR